MQALIEIDREALRANVRALKAFVAPARFTAVVKADAYGHGLALVATTIRDLVDGFCVYEVAEATLLRAAGIDCPIHLIGPLAVAEMDAALAARTIIPLWSNGAWLRDLTAAARRAGVRVPMHLKLDTGLSRLGVRAEAAPALLAAVSSLDDITVTGGYSHLASAEELDSRYTTEQLERFERALPPRAGFERHIAASAAALLWPATRLDLVRAGIAIYGLWPSVGSRRRLHEQLRLTPVLSWRTPVVMVNEVAAETPVGYGSTYRPAADARIAILPIGYAEGVPRALSNAGRVLINGVSCPIIGRICMNMTLVDATAVPNPRPGMLATLIGESSDRDGNVARISADEVADALDTISYEVVARLPATIPRRFAA